MNNSNKFKLLATIIVYSINFPLFALAMENFHQKNKSMIEAITGGAYHNLILYSDGSVWAYGNGAYGQLGNGEAKSHSLPTRVLIDIPIIQIAAGQKHSLILGTDRKIYAFGSNEYGQINNNNPILIQSTPIPVPNLSDIVLIADGGNHSLALKSDYSVWAWGKNDHGQCGRSPNDVYISSPTRLNTELKAVKLAAGDHHSIALMEDGTILAWGSNIYGQLGNGTWIDYSYEPVKVQGLTDVIEIATGGEHSIALRKDGTVWTWGRNHAGQLGNGQVTHRNLPLQVFGLPKIVAIDGEGSFTIALDANGNLWGFGSNRDGQLGVRCNSNKQTLPVKIKSLPHISKIAAGHFHTIVLDENGLIWGFGRNDYGQLGNSYSTEQCPPVEAICVNESNPTLNCY